jgi:hypothetical protein
MDTDCLARICQFARHYRSERDRTPRQLYDATRYTACHATITQDDIEQVVTRDPTLIADWLAFTEDKRWTPAWGLSKRSETHWIVFHGLRDGTFDYELPFRSAIPACALLIRFEMKRFRCDTQDI